MASSSGQGNAQAAGGFAMPIGSGGVRVVPFRALRPPVAIAGEVAAPPYDVLNSSEARVLAEGNERSFLRVNKPEIDLPVDMSQYDAAVYEKGAANLHEFIERGFLHRDETPCLYVYAQRMGEHIQAGICASVPVEDYANGKIKRHENTTVKKENDRTRLTYAQNANAGPVFLTYQQAPTVDAIVERVMAGEPETNVTDQAGVEHTVWPVTEPSAIVELQRAFLSVPCSYIADGHHRSASAFRVGEMKIKEAIATGQQITGAETFCYFMAVLFPHNQLRILEYNRVVKNLNGFTREQFMERLGVDFDIVRDDEHRTPTRQREVAMCLYGEWFTLTMKSSSYSCSDPVASLDVQILYDNLLAPILGIGNLRTDERIQFVGGIRGHTELERLVTGDKEGAVAFEMFPVSVRELMDISDADMLMPPKVTWFEPKLASGLIVRTYDENSDPPLVEGAVPRNAMEESK